MHGLDRHARAVLEKEASLLRHEVERILLEAFFGQWFRGWA
jgi:hypothetical protein